MELLELSLSTSLLLLRWSYSNPKEPRGRENAFHWRKYFFLMLFGVISALPLSQVEYNSVLYSFQSALDNSTQSSGLAVAIGIGIACAMVGTASIALVTKKLFRKKTDGDDDDDEPRPDDP